MSEFTDLIIRTVGGIQALLIIGLGLLDLLQTKYMKGRFDRQGQRIGRLEDQFIATDGGEDE